MAQSIGLLDHFSALKDLREQWRVLNPLREVLLLLLCGTLSGMDDFVEINLWGGAARFSATVLALRDGVPSHDTLNDIVNRWMARSFRIASRRGWRPARQQSRHRCDHGKTRRTYARSKGREPLHPGVGLGKPSALGVGAGGRDRQVQRDRRDPSLSSAWS